MSVNSQADAEIQLLQDAIHKPIVIDASGKPLTMDISNATNLSCPPKLKPLIIPEEGLVGHLGLLTPVDETPDDAESTNYQHFRPLPVPKSEERSNRPRARSWATWSADSRVSDMPTSSRALISPNHLTGFIAPSNRSRSQTLQSFKNAHNDNATLIPPIRSTVSRTREGRSLTVSYASESRPSVVGRVSTPKLPPSRTSLPSPPDRQFLSRARANTNTPAVPKHRVQNWIASPIATPNTVSETRSADTLYPKLLGPKVKALPKIPLTPGSASDETVRDGPGEDEPRLTAKEKGKGKAIDCLPHSVLQNVSDKAPAKHGLLTPPESAKSPASPNASLSGLRGSRPRGPRTRRSTIG